MKFEGVFSVLPTPFTDSEKVDLEGLRRVVDLFIKAGVDGVTALGVTGEVARLNDRERASILDTVLEHVNGRVPVIAGTSADGRNTCIEYSRNAQIAGVSAVMVSPPRMPKLNSDAVLAHFSALSSAVDLEIVIQDHPPISGFSMEPLLLARIAREVSRARTIKLEDPPTPFKTSRILAQCQGIEVSVLGGLGGVFLLEELMAGASGVMTGFGYPEMLVEVVKLFKSGELDEAADAFYRYVPLMRFEFQEGLGMSIRKEVLHRRGVLAEATIRAPGTMMGTSDRAALDLLLRWMREKQRMSWT